MSHDVITNKPVDRNRWIARARALLQSVTQAGKQLEPPETLETIRHRFRDEVAVMPKILKGLQPNPHRVEVSDKLKLLAQKADQQGH